MIIAVVVLSVLLASTLALIALLFAFMTRDLDSEEILEKSFDIAIENFGSGCTLYYARDSDGEFSIYVVCRDCSQKNRLAKGLKGAVCGACKKPLSRFDSSASPVATSMVN